jgi:periplasmic nitrate reductase NapD
VTEPAEIHISSVVARVLPEAVAHARQQIAVLRDAEIVHEREGRLVIVIECGSTGRTLDVLDAIRALPGVLSAELAYQHAEAASVMNETLQESQP